MKLLARAVAIFITIFLMSCLVESQSEPREQVERILPNSLNLFNNQNASNKNVDPKVNSTKERGQLQFLRKKWLRVFVRKVKHLCAKLGNSIGISSQNATANRKIFTLDFLKSLKAIYPGTNFCGDGDIAGESRRLGYFSDTDNCCRNHDGCKLGIAAGETKYGLENTGTFTRSHCKCDEQFHKCLKKVNSHVSNNIGFTFFSILGPQCFKEEPQVIKCAEENWGRCIKYEFSKSGKRLMQWFDNPTY